MKKRKTVSLDAKLDTRVNSYVTSASANAYKNRNLFTAVVIGTIGLSSLAVPELLPAEVVFTRTNVKDSNGFLSVDLNNDGVADFRLFATNYLYSSQGFLRDSLFASEVNGNQILRSNAGFVAAEAQGQLVGPGGQFGGGLMARCLRGGFGTTQTGPWLNVKNRFLGVKFLIKGETHYGWARLTATCGYANLTGYAYETVPNKPIVTGFAVGGFGGTLGGLARGADTGVRVRKKN